MVCMLLGCMCMCLLMMMLLGRLLMMILVGRRLMRRMVPLSLTRFLTYRVSLSPPSMCRILGRPPMMPSMVDLGRDHPIPRSGLLVLRRRLSMHMPSMPRTLLRVRKTRLLPTIIHSGRPSPSSEVLYQDVSSFVRACRLTHGRCLTKTLRLLFGQS